MARSDRPEKHIPLGGIGPKRFEDISGPTLPMPYAPQEPLDNWDKQRTSTFACVTCMHYLNFRCRRHAPRGLEGWPAVYPSDFCGDHKMNKSTMAGRA